MGGGSRHRRCAARWQRREGVLRGRRRRRPVPRDARSRPRPRAEGRGGLLRARVPPRSRDPSLSEAAARVGPRHRDGRRHRPDGRRVAPRGDAAQPPRDAGDHAGAVSRRGRELVPVASSRPSGSVPRADRRAAERSRCAVVRARGPGGSRGGSRRAAGGHRPHALDRRGRQRRRNARRPAARLARGGADAFGADGASRSH